MADGPFLSQDNIVCRFFYYGDCKDGDKCLFSHDSTRSVPDSVCRYHLQGKCIFGVNCRYDHIMYEKDSLKSNSTNERLLPDQSICSGATNWINAPEFVPKEFRLYSDVVKKDTSLYNEPKGQDSQELCPFFAEGYCPFPNCQKIHGNICELCQKACLHPFDEKARNSHLEKCEKEFEENMEYSFAMQRSLDKTCPVCMDVVLKKEPESERRFGILEKCNHVYCLKCIRDWRKRYENDYKVPRSCPQCRVVSDFVISSAYFVEDEKEKAKLISDYKEALSKKHCKYFKHGDGVCAFGPKCFYLHAKPDGTKIDYVPPTRRRRQNEDGELVYVEILSLWNYIEHREENSDLWYESEIHELLRQ